MNRKILTLILTGVISFLLVTGCSSQNGSADAPNADATQGEAGADQEAAQEEIAAILPADAVIGIVCTEGEGDFTDSFLAKTTGYLVAAGIPEENITTTKGAAEELTANAQKQIDGGCSVLMVGGADEKTAPGITDAAAKAKIPVVYFGTNPGEAEIARWESEGYRAAYVGSTYGQAAQKRADLLDGTDLEKLDPAKDDNVGLVVLSTEADKPGDTVNRDTLELVKELDHPIYVLTEEEEEDAEASEEEQDSEASEETAEENPDEASEAASGEAAAEGAEQEEEISPEEVRERAKEQVLDWMKEYGKQLDVILCADDMQALGAWDAVSEEKKLVGHDVLIMGFDCGRESLEEVASGNIRSTFFNDFMEQSSNASNAVLAFLKGIAVEPVMTSEYVSVTVDNAQEILDISVTVQESEPEQDSEETTQE
ncbi:MAG: substrate-binding domain-containing protein [Lachnospiraceae bacterium]|nr:substrate-binding domain-containing protein [Lachnospiraceae bacterium]